MKLWVSLTLVLVACGPSPRNHGGGDDGTDASTAQCVPTAETCDDMVDNDCDGLTDCNDPDCSGVGTCPVCGMVQHPLSQPLALPDGDGAGPPYTSKLHFDGFGATQVFENPSNILSVCLTIEHSWVRDIQIELHSPPGLGGGPPKVLVLQQMLGRTGGEIYLGQANDKDDANNPIPGVGADYCWKPTATNPAWLAYANAGGVMNMVADAGDATSTGHKSMPPGDYSAAGPAGTGVGATAWSALMGAPLNGDWEILVQDKWGADNGFIFKWSIAFDPTLVVDCSGPVIQ